MKPFPFSHPLVAVALVVAGVFALAGCSVLPTPRKDPTRHYVLTGPAATEVEAAAAKGTLKVGVRSVQVAPYLDGKAMIVRRAGNEIDYRDYARWAEPLSAGVSRMLTARLLASGRVARVFPQPYPFDVVRDLDVAVTVLSAEGEVTADGATVVSFVCALEVTRAHEGAGAGEVLLRETFVAPPIAWTDGDHAALASGLSKGVAALAERVIAALPAE
ncbi:MAG: membrane integrity-associated transporter subunit PqiC [Burkholderiales bacterium]|nr:membrane integrity-associated transporter subunit PqiC [Opitutaceae bacterium]